MSLHDEPSHDDLAELDLTAAQADDLTALLRGAAARVEVPAPAAPVRYSSRRPPTRWLAAAALVVEAGADVHHLVLVGLTLSANARAPPIAAAVEGDVELALRVWRTDDEVDELYTSLCESINQSAARLPDMFTAHMHLLFIAKSLERIGDHATNIAEVVHFVSTGRPLLDERPRADRSRGDV